MRPLTRQEDGMTRSDEGGLTLWRCQACPTIIPARYGHRPVTVDQHEKRHEEETT